MVVPSSLMQFRNQQEQTKTSGGEVETVGEKIHRAPTSIDFFALVDQPSCLTSIFRAGLEADRLLMTFRLFSAWLLSLLTTIFLNENCLGGWKVFWIVCDERHPQHQSFNWQNWGEEILSTKKDRLRGSDKR